ncbi:hypothetical protein B0H14DRAFT_3606778 [Mycena olivaceomarginata]|nr:hypothetical protein B0H14DRAFT_3606778 [Mycena olivaceomarginata]
MDPTTSFNPHTTGAFLISILVSYVLVGVATTQTYIYYGWFLNDSPRLKALVAFVWYIASTVISGERASIHRGLYVYTICDYWHLDRIFGGDPSTLLSSSTASSQPVPPSLMRSVQVFFDFRIYTFSRKLYIPILIWTMVSLCLLAGFGNFISGLLMASLADHNRHWLWLSEFVWSISMATDLMIAATLVFHLHQQRKKVDKSSRTAVLMHKVIL